VEVGCTTNSTAMATLNEIATAYIRDFRMRAARERRWFAIQRSLEEAISLAALARGPGGKRLSHQRRIPGSVLADCRRQLLSAIPRLRRASTFEKLHQVVLETVGVIRGAGELYVYDTTVRIGANLGLEPQLVFLHRGTREGARSLGFEPSRKTISPEEFPAVLRKLKPLEIEDALCIYKSQLVRATVAERRNSVCAIPPKRGRGCSKSQRGP
jgi:hypothetical protein